MLCEPAIHVLAIKIRAFSNRFGELTAIVLLRMKPERQTSKSRQGGEDRMLTFIQIRVGQFAAHFLDDLDVLQIYGSLDKSSIQLAS